MGLTVYGGGGKPEEEKTVTAGTSTKVVTPSNGKTIKKVTVNPTPSQSKTVTPSTSQQTVSPDSGKLLSQVIVKAMEDVTPEVTAQTPVITQIAENLGVTITIPSGTNKQILQGNNANLLNIKNNAKKEGAYVWKKLTAEGGDFVDFVVSDSETTYPDGGEQGGYWYEKVVEGVDLLSAGGFTKVAVDKFTLTSDTLGSSYAIPHTLGTTPKAALLFTPNGSIAVSSKSQILGLFSMYTYGSRNARDNSAGGVMHTLSSGGYFNSYDNGFNFSATTATIRSKNLYSSYLIAGVEYTLITMA